MGHFIWMKSVFGWLCVCKSRKHLHSQNGVCCVIVCYSSVLFWFKFEICIPILLSNRRWFDCKQRQKHSTNCSKQKQQRADTSVDTHTTHTHTRVWQKWNRCIGELFLLLFVYCKSIHNGYGLMTCDDL